MSTKFWQRVFSFVVLAGLLLSLAKPGTVQAKATVKPSAALAVQEDPLTKIEKQVLDELAEKGQTDFFIWMKEKADLSPAEKLTTKAEKGEFVFNTLRATADRTQNALRASLSAQGVQYEAFYIANKVLVRGGSHQLALDMATRADVAKITANHQFQLQEPFILPNAPNFPTTVESNILFVNADDVWALGVTGQGTVMAGNDTGIQWDHPALINKYRGWNGTTADHNYNWWDATGTYPTVPADGFGHGTHTTGTMVGDDGAGNQIGMAPGAKTIHCKNMDDGGGGDDGTFTTCFEWDLAPWDLNGQNALPSMAPDAINNSWGYWGGNAPQFEDEIAALQAAGIVVEVSAGNEGSYCSTLRSPGDYEQVVTTGSVNHASGVLPGTLTGFSSRGPSILYPGDYFPDVMAPGENIRSSVPGSAYEGGWSGTSMAGPHVTALIGLMWSANPALRGQVAQTYQIIDDTAVPLTGQGGSGCGGDYTVGPNNDWGFGTIDALAAVQMAIAMGGAGQLDGTVTDAVTSLPVANVAVTALHDEGYSWTVSTNASGYYTVTVAAGTFTVSTSHPGYQAASEPGVVVYTDTLTTQDFSLTPRGILEGYVTDSDNGFPLGAEVMADDGTTVNTNPATGYYMMYLDPGTFDVTASADNYAPRTASVDITSGVTTQQNFALEAAVSFAPSPLEATLTYGDEGISVSAVITNRLPTPYTFEFKEKATGYTPALLSLPPFEGVLERNPAPASIERAPNAQTTSPEAISEFLSNVLAGEPAYGVDVNYEILGYFPDTTMPGTWTIIGNVPGTAYFGGDFLNGDFSVEYVVDYYTNALYRLDTATAAATYVGPAVPGGGEDWTGLAGSTDGTLYGSATTCSSSTLYEVDPDTGATTAIGPITNGPCIIDIAVSVDGELYGVDIINDVLVEIDPATGAGTVIGSLGVDANYAQGLDFEEDTGILYWASWNWNVYGGELRVIDTGTGNSTSVGAFPDYAEIDSFAFATGGAGADVPWLGEDPITGTVPASSTLTAAGTLAVTAYFTATAAVGVDQPGEYHANLRMKGTPSLDIPVNMTVEPPPTWGKLAGTVTGLGYCDVNPSLLADAEVFVEGEEGYSVLLTTDENGAFQWWLDEMYSPLTVTVTLAGYEIAQATDVVIEAPDTTTVDFNLRWLQPCAIVTPDSLETSLDFGQTDTQQVTIYNDGGGDLHFQMVERDKGYSGALLSLPPFEGVLERNPAPASIERAPNAKSATPAAISEFLSHVLAGEPAYGVDVNNEILGYFPDTTMPGTWTIIGYVPGTAYFGGDFLNGDFSVEYVVDYYTNALYRLDTATAAATYVGPAVPGGGEDWTGLAGSTDGTLYGSATTCSSSTLYEVDPDTGATTAIGPITNGPCIIDIAVNADGDMYGVDIINDVLVEIDPATGAGTVIGSLGVDANYAQGLDFEEDTGILYWASWNFNVYGGELRVIDTSTGNSTSVGAFPSYAEIDSFAFATGGAGDVPWLYEDPITGTIPVDDSGMVDVTFDANMVGQPGVYTADVIVKSNDPVNNKIAIPVTMTISAPADWGKLQGTVISWGYCDANPAPLDEAEIYIVGDGGMRNWTLWTDDAGTYSYWFDQAYSPMTMTVTYPDHSVGTAIVDVTGGMTTTQDFELRWLVPCVTETPASLSVDVPMGEVTTTLITLANTGAGALTFELKEVNGGYTPALEGEDVLVVAYDDYSGSTQAVEDALTANGATYLEVTEATFLSMSVDELLEYQAVFYVGIPFSSSQILLMAYLDAGGSLFVADNDVGYSQGSSVFYTGYLQATYMTDNGGATLIGEDFMSGLTLAIPGDPYPDGFTVGSEGLEIFYFDSSGYAGGVAVERNDYKAIYLSFDFVFLTDTAVATDLIGRVLDFLTPSDMPWLAEDPVSGIVPPDTGVQDIAITFDSSVVPQPGHYNGVLKVKSDDPMYGLIKIPVDMNVIPTPDYGILVGTVTSLGYCDLNSAPLEGAIVQIEDTTGMTYTVETDVNGYYSRYLSVSNGPYIVSVIAEDHTFGFAYDVEIISLGTTTQDFELRWLMPCISTNPGSLDVEVGQGYSLTLPLSLINNGALSTAFELKEKAAGSSQTTRGTNGQVHIVAETKDKAQEPEASVGLPGGGTDPFGYEFADSNEAGGPSYDWIEIAPPEGGNGVPLYMNGIDDGYYWPLDLPFAFNFYGTDYTQLAVESNGGLAFDSLYLPFYNSPIPGDNGYVSRFIAHLWDDLYIVPGDVYYLEMDNMVILEYYQVSRCCASPDSATWEVILFNNGNILFQYQDVTFGDYGDNGADATVGIQGDISTGLQYSYNTPTLTDGLAICFAYPGQSTDCAPYEAPWLTEAPVTGTIGADSFTDVSVTFDTMTYTLGSQVSAIIKVNTNDPVNRSFEVPVTMTVVVPMFDMEISADQTGYCPLGQVLMFNVTITNTSNGPSDVFTMSLSTSTWASALDVTEVGPLAVGESAVVHVSVSVPESVILPAHDTVQITATSHGNPAMSATSTLTTYAVGDFGVDLEPEVSAAAGSRGDVITYTLWLTNTGMMTDTITVTVSGAGAAWVTLPDDTFMLGAGETVDVIVVVTIPADAVMGDYPVTVTATSMHDPTQTDDVEITTSVVQYSIYLPLIWKAP